MRLIDISESWHEFSNETMEVTNLFNELYARSITCVGYWVAWSDKLEIITNIFSTGVE